MSWIDGRMFVFPCGCACELIENALFGLVDHINPQKYPLNASSDVSLWGQNNVGCVKIYKAFV